MEKMSSSFCIVGTLLLTLAQFISPSLSHMYIVGESPSHDQTGIYQMQMSQDAQSRNFQLIDVLRGFNGSSTWPDGHRQTASSWIDVANSFVVVGEGSTVYHNWFLYDQVSQHSFPSRSVEQVFAHPTLRETIVLARHHVTFRHQLFVVNYQGQQVPGTDGSLGGYPLNPYYEWGPFAFSKQKSADSLHLLALHSKQHPHREETLPEISIWTLTPNVGKLERKEQYQCAAMTIDRLKFAVWSSYHESWFVLAQNSTFSGAKPLFKILELSKSGCVPLITFDAMIVTGLEVSPDDQSLYITSANSNMNFFIRVNLEQSNKGRVTNIIPLQFTPKISRVLGLFWSTDNLTIRKYYGNVPDNRNRTNNQNDINDDEKTPQNIGNDRKISIDEIPWWMRNEEQQQHVPTASPDERGDENYDMPRIEQDSVEQSQQGESNHNSHFMTHAQYRGGNDDNNHANSQTEQNNHVDDIYSDLKDHQPESASEPTLPPEFPDFNGRKYDKPPTNNQQQQQQQQPPKNGQYEFPEYQGEVYPEIGGDNSPRKI